MAPSDTHSDKIVLDFFRSCVQSTHGAHSNRDLTSASGRQLKATAIVDNTVGVSRILLTNSSRVLLKLSIEVLLDGPWLLVGALSIKIRNFI